MPQGPLELHAKFGDDSTAIALLEKAGYRERHFTFHPPRGHVPTKEEGEAINYLCLEWDYEYDSTPIEELPIE